MNKLSYALWLSDALPTLGSVAGMLAFVTFIVCLILTAAYVVTSFMSDDKEAVIGNRVCGWLVLCAWPLYLTLQATYIVMPSKSTIMMIAASEASGMVVSSPEGKEIINDSLTVIRQYLKSQIKEAK